MNDLSVWKYFICGGVGGACTVIIGHPFDTIKVRLQTMPVSKHLYGGTLDCFKKTITTEGVRGLYKGIGAPLIGTVPTFGTTFMVFDIGLKLFGSKDSRSTHLQLFTAGAFSGHFTALITAPSERIKCLLQVQQNSEEKMYSGTVDCAKKLYIEGGIRNIYRGIAATLLRDIPGTGVYFLTYEAIKECFNTAPSSPSLKTAVLAGAAAGIAYWVIGMPADVLKSRLQTAPTGKYPNGIRDVFKVLLQTEGLFALYKGFTPVLLRAVPANAACFVGFEFSANLLNSLPLGPVIHISRPLQS